MGHCSRGGPLAKAFGTVHRVQRAPHGRGYTP